MKIKVLGAHNYESRSTRYVSLLIDDRFAVDAGSLTCSLSFEEQRNLEFVLLTHQHYDHIRDIPALAINLFSMGTQITIYAPEQVSATIRDHLLNGDMYPRFDELPEDRPTINFQDIRIYEPMKIEGYTVLAVPVNHHEITVGYQITDASNTTVFYTSDTGPGLSECWDHVSPQLILTEVTLSNEHEEFARKTRHLTPNLLKDELVQFFKLKGYYPDIVVLHINPHHESSIKDQLSSVAQSLNTTITLACEGLEITL